MRLHHVGWAVRSIAKSRPYFEEQLGLTFDGEEEFPGVKIAFYDVGGSLVELLEPTDTGQNEVQEYVATRGEGIHHLAYEVPDVTRALADARERGLELLDERPRPGARETMIAFIDPHREDGILVEFVEPPGGPNS